MDTNKKQPIEDGRIANPMPLGFYQTVGTIIPPISFEFEEDLPMDEDDLPADYPDDRLKSD